MKFAMRRVTAFVLSVVMLCTMLPMMTASVSAADSTGPMLAYVPLDNRPVVYQRVQMAAGAAGFDIRVPDNEEWFCTKLDGQGGTGVNGSQHGDGAAIMNWLDTMEAQGCDYYIIHLDQMLSGGLVGSRHPDSQTVTQAEADILNRLLDLANTDGNRVYFIDIVMRLASTGSYKGYESAQYDALRNWGSKDRYEMKTSFKTQDYNESVTMINQIASNYRKDPNSATIAYDTSALTEANVNEYLAFRKRKLTLMNMIIQELEPGTPYLVGVDDSSPNKNIQWNEMAFLDARAEAMQLDYVRMSDTDSLGLMAVARCVNDLYGVRPRLQVRYFGNKADASDDYGNDTLRENVDKHIECLNAQSVSSNAEMEVLVLTQPDSSPTDSTYKSSINNLVARAKANIANDLPTIVIDVSEKYGHAWVADSTNLQDELFKNVSLGQLMGYSNWNTVGNAIGIALGIGVSRYSYIRYEENIASSSHDWHLQSLTYAYVKDMAYNARNKLNPWGATLWTGSFNYWLTNTKAYNGGNHYANIVKDYGNIAAGRSYINGKLEKFMKGKGESGGVSVGTFDVNADAIVEKLKASRIYTNLNRTVQTMEIDTLSTSNYYFPWDRMFEIYFSVSGTLGNVSTHYKKENTLISQIPVSQSFTQFSSNAKSQYGATAVTVKNLSGATLSSSSVVGTGFTVTMTISGAAVTCYAVVYGDTDGSGTVTTTDVRETMQKTLGIASFSNAQTAAADLDGNGRVASTDARRILQIALSARA